MQSRLPGCPQWASAGADVSRWQIVGWPASRRQAPSRPRLQSFPYGVRVAGDHPEIRARSLIRLGCALLPISQRPERNLKPRSELFLVRPSARRIILARGVCFMRAKLSRGEWLRVGIAQCRRHHLVSVMDAWVRAAGSSVAHVSLLPLSVVPGSAHYASLCASRAARAPRRARCARHRAYCGG